MAENEPVKVHPEVEPVTQDASKAQTTMGESDNGSLVDTAPTDGAVNTPHPQKPKDDANASDPSAPPDAPPTSDNTGNAIVPQPSVATVSGQVTNPGPQHDGSRSESRAVDSAPATETAASATTTLATPTPTKRFTSMNINKKFLAKTAAGSSSSSNSPAPKASTSTSTATRPAVLNPQPSSRLITKKLTAVPVIPPASGGWSLRPTPPTSLSSSPAPGDVSAPSQSAKLPPAAEANHSNRPALITSASGLSVDARSPAKASREQSPAKAWATIPTAVGDGKRNLQDFPTAAEAAADSAEHKRPGTSTGQPPHHQALDVAAETDTDARDSFRGMHLDPNAHHWDEMEDESNDFLGEVIDFGDGKTYAVPHEEHDSTPASTTAKNGSRLGDDYDRSWPRSRPPQSEPEGAHASRFPQHGLPPRQSDNRHLFNERSNRLEPAKAPPPTGGSAFHQHAPPYAHLPPRSAPRRNSTLSSSDRPKLGHGREPPPHAREPPPHAQTGFPPDGKTRRPSDARSSHSPIERRSSFLQDDERPRMGSIGFKGRAPEDSGLGLKRETSHDSRLSGGDRRSWSRASSHPVDPLHHTGTLSSGAIHHTPEKGTPEPSNASDTVRSPLQANALHTGAPEPVTQPAAPAVLNEEREKYMKMAAERARRRRQEEEAAREEARERAKKKAAELEALSKASLVSASPLRQASGAKSPGSKFPLARSPSVTPSALPAVPLTTELHSNKNETLTPESAATAASSWRKPLVETKSSSSAPDDKPREPQAPPPPTAAQLSGIGMPSIEELGNADGPVEVLDFSDMGKLAGRRTSITSPSESHRRRRSTASDFLDEPLGSKRTNQGQPNAWNRDPKRVLVCIERVQLLTEHSRPTHEAHEGRDRTVHGRQSSSSKPTNESTWSRAAPSTGAGMSAAGPGPGPTGPRPAFKEAPISALDDVMSRIKGVLTDMHAEEKPTSTTGPVLTASKAASGVASRWMGSDTSSWRDNMGKKQPNGRLVEPTPTEPFATTRPERPDTPPPAWKTFTVHISKSSIARPPLSKKQASLAKLPPMPVRWDILTWDPPVERMSNRTLSRDDVLFPKTYIRGVLSAWVNLPSTGSAPKQSEPTQRPRLTATIDAKPSRSPTAITRPLPKSPAFMDTQWRKPQQPVTAAAAPPVENALELQNTTSVQAEGNQLETTSRSPPPYHQADRERGKPTANMPGPTPSNSSKVLSKPSRSPEVTFHRSLHEKRPSNPPTVSFTVSSELDEVSAAPEEIVVTESPKINNSVEVKEDAPAYSGEDSSGEKSEQTGSGGKTQSPTPNSSVLLTPPVKVTPPWQSSNSRLPDNEFIKSVWQHAPSKDATATENSLRGLTDDFPSSIPHSVQEMKTEDEEPKPSQPTASAPSRVPHNAHRAFQVPTSPAPMHMQIYANHMGNQAVPVRPIPVSNFSLPPPAPPQPAAQPTPYSPYVHPTPTLMYGMPPNRIAPSPAPGPPMWVQGQPYGRPSPPAGMYPGQQGHAMSYPSPVTQLPPPLNKPHGGMNGNHGHHLASPAMSHAMHMGSPAMGQVTHMGSPAMPSAVPHMPGPQHMYPSMTSPGGLGLGNNMGYGAQRPGPQMMQQSPMQAAVPNGYPMVPGGSYPPGGYGRGAMRNPSDGMPHHMPVHPQHAPVSPAAYHPNAYGRW